MKIRTLLEAAALILCFTIVMIVPHPCEESYTQSVQK